MKNATSLTVLRLLAVFLCLVYWFPACSATLERLSLDEMINKSTSIVRGRVTGSYAALRGSVVYTHLGIQVLEQWKGAKQALVEVIVPGGSAGGIRQSFSGVPHLEEGKEYVLFLWTGRSGSTQIIGFTQGVFNLAKNAGGESMAVRAASTETMLEPGTGRVVKDECIEMPLRDLSARISTAGANGAVR